MTRSIYGRLALIALLVFPAMVLAFRSMSLSSNVVVQTDTLPERIGPWTGRLEPLTDTELNILHSPAASQRIYTNESTGDRVQVLIIQVENTQNAHDPRLCMSGSGYAESSTQEEPAPWAEAKSRNNLVSHSVFSNQGEALDMYYWMSTRQGTVPNMSVGLKLEGIMRALRGEPTQGIAVRVLGRPNAYDGSKSTSPAALKELWKQLSSAINFDDLIQKQ